MDACLPLSLSFEEPLWVAEPNWSLKFPWGKQEPDVISLRPYHCTLPGLCHGLRSREHANTDSSDILKPTEIRYGRYVTENRILCLWLWKLQTRSLALDKHRQAIVVVLDPLVSLDNGGPEINPTHRSGSRSGTNTKSASQKSASSFPKGLVCWGGHL